MAFQDESGRNRSNIAFLTGNRMRPNAGLQTPQLKEQFRCGNDYSPKIRKPYTITKQRERWTEEEHKKFLEALKLYGRAWRQIEEHLGTKTAVQIRSHAQKFFSKVVREGYGSSASAVEPIEIPPPRPKRKPMHPYPRKMVHPLNQEHFLPEKLPRSSSPNFSISERENQSPTSVLTAVGSADSNTPNRSLSPVSCHGVSHPAELNICGSSTPEDDGLPSPAAAAAEAEDVHSRKKLELFPAANFFSEENLNEETSPRILKLFGRTVFVNECQRLSSPPKDNSKLDTNDAKPVEPQPWNFTAAELQGNGESSLNQSAQGPSGAICYFQIQKENSSSVDFGSVNPLPWCAFYGGVPIPSMPCHKQENGEVQDEIRKESFRTSSDCNSVNGGENIDNNTEADTESRGVSSEVKELHPVYELKPSENADSSNKCVKGFTQYKKRRVEGNRLSSTVTVEDDEERKTRLSL